MQDFDFAHLLFIGGIACVAFGMADGAIDRLMLWKLRRFARPHDIMNGSAFPQSARTAFSAISYLKSGVARFGVLVSANRDIGTLQRVMLMAFGSLIAVFTLCFWMFRAPLPSVLIGMMTAGLAGLFALQHFKRQRDVRISTCLPESFDGLVRCLRSGFDLNRSLAIIGDEAIPLLRPEFRRVLRERDYGQNLPAAIRNMAERLGNEELSFFATLISVQERSGGPLIEALDSLSQILKDRERIRRKRMSASAEARMSASILGGLPVCVAAALFMINPSYRDALLGTESGRAFLLLALILFGIGSFVMYRLVKAEP